jgi:hypothetical protein
MGFLKIPVLKVAPFHEIKRGRPTFNDTSLIFNFIYQTTPGISAMQISSDVPSHHRIWPLALADSARVL